MHRGWIIESMETRLLGREIRKSCDFLSFAIPVPPWSFPRKQESIHKTVEVVSRWNGSRLCGNDGMGTGTDCSWREDILRGNSFTSGSLIHNSG